MTIREQMSLTTRTVNKHLSRIKRVFQYAQRTGIIDSHPSDGLSVKELSGPSNSPRKPFSEEDLKAFIAGYRVMDQHWRPHIFWLPLLGMYTGARLGELAQLRLEDVHEEDGVLCIRICDQYPDQTIKTWTSRRLIPVHPKLIELGFTNFIDERRRRGKTRLFPEIKKHKTNGWSHAPSAWFRRFRERCGVMDHGKVFHSFRHTMINNLKQQGVEERLVAAIVGHANDEITFDTYSKDYNPRFKYEVISKVNYPIDFGLLKHPKFNPYLNSRGQFLN